LTWCNWALNLNLQSNMALWTATIAPV